MLVVGLTGRIGYGKSTVERLLIERGAVLIDGDTVARQVVAPGGAAYDALRDRFPEAFGDDGHLDRPKLAAIAFADDVARTDLNNITHPAIGAEMVRQMADAAAADPDAIVVMDIPLLVEGQSKRDHLAAVIVVDTPTDSAVRRLVEFRGFDEDDARARIGAQATREERRAIADFVIDNSGTEADLVPQIDDVWERLQKLNQ